MSLRSKLTAAGAILAFGLGTTFGAAAITVTKAVPTAWVPNGNDGTGVTLGVFEAPQGGRVALAAYFANDNDGNVIWLVTSFATSTGANVFADLPLIQNSGGSLNPGSPLEGTQVGTVTITFVSCNEMIWEISLDDGTSETVTFTPTDPAPACVWQDPFDGRECPAFTTGEDADVPGACVLPAELNESVTLTNDLHWVISDDGFNFGPDQGVDGTDGATLTIEPGTVVFGEPAATAQDAGAFFSIRRGNIIDAQGEPEAPIVFTSKGHILDPTQTQPAQWGGVILYGQGPTNDCDVNGGCIDELELNVYGGTLPEASSGIMRYVRIEYAGTEIDALAELNGLSLYANGTSTILDHIHVHRNGDDGFEWFSSRAPLRFAVVTDVDDDSYDWTSGAQFNGQYWIARMTETAVKDARCFEGDNLGDDASAEPFSAPNVANVTCYYEANPQSAEAPNAILRIRRGTQGNFSNLLLTGATGDLSARACLRITEEQTEINIDDGTLVIENSVFDSDCSDTIYEDERGAAIGDRFPTVQVTDVDFAIVPAGINGGAEAGVALIPSSAPSVSVPSDYPSFFDNTTFPGAVAPGSESDYTAGEWTNIEPEG